MNDTAHEFEARLRNLISEKTNGGETTTDVRRSEVERIGEGLDIPPRQACTQFFALQGFVWDVANMSNSMIGSNESGQFPPPRNWLGINDVYLV